MTAPADDREKDRIRRIAGLLYQASRSIRVLGSIDWSPEVKAEFFARGARELPQVSYQPLDPTPAIEAVREARRSISDHYDDRPLARSPRGYARARA